MWTKRCKVYLSCVHKNSKLQKNATKKNLKCYNWITQVCNKYVQHGFNLVCLRGGMHTHFGKIQL